MICWEFSAYCHTANPAATRMVAASAHHGTSGRRFRVPGRCRRRFRVSGSIPGVPPVTSVRLVRGGAGSGFQSRLAVRSVPALIRDSVPASVPVTAGPDPPPAGPAGPAPRPPDSGGASSRTTTWFAGDSAGGSSSWMSWIPCGQAEGSSRRTMTASATASGTEMTIMGMPANRPASSSGRPGMSQAITSTAGKTVTAANSTPGTRCQVARRRGAGGRSASRAALRGAPVPVALIVATAPGRALAAPPDPPGPNASLPEEPESWSASPSGVPSAAASPSVTPVSAGSLGPAGSAGSAISADSAESARRWGSPGSASSAAPAWSAGSPGLAGPARLAASARLPASPPLSDARSPRRTDPL